MIDAATFRAIAEQAGYVVRCYSGRGMFGRQCVAIDETENGVPVLVQDLMTMAGALALYGVGTYDVDHDTMLDVLADAETDNMGIGIVVYWPSIAWEAEA